MPASAITRTAPLISKALHLANTPLLMSVLSQKSDDWPHIAVKIQCNKAPNGRPQFTQVPLQYWAVIIIPSSYNLHISPLSKTIPKERNF